jgi:hypothetical protein
MGVTLAHVAANSGHWYGMRISSSQYLIIRGHVYAQSETVVSTLKLQAGQQACMESKQLVAA